MQVLGVLFMVMGAALRVGRCLQARFKWPVHDAVALLVVAPWCWQDRSPPGARMEVFALNGLGIFSWLTIRTTCWWSWLIETAGGTSDKAHRPCRP